jgi:hypothetical protein
MNEGLFSRTWFVSVIAGWVAILVLDELAYYWWKKINPGSTWSGILVKHPPTVEDNTGSNSIPNGYRPAGGP